MTDKKYKLRFLPLFEQDINDTVDYISLKLKNPGAAQKLINEIQAAIRKRQACPKSFEPYHSKKEHKYPYYRIYVRNYTIYYVVIYDTMEVRRLLYQKRDREAQI
mgnify:FL=1